MTQDVSKLEGQILGGTYRVERKLGQGGMGAVYEASHTRLPRRFAIKMLSLAMAEYEDVVTRFKREAMVTSELGHPHIVEVVDFNHTDAGLPYIVMELLEGEDLETLLEREGRLSLTRAALIFGQVASALHAAHRHNIIHRDLKPPNIFMCRREDGADFAKVVDFGISKVLGSDSVVTQTQATMGTPAYMSPEQAEGHSAEVDARTDIFAMGTILYAMLTGQPPFLGPSLPAILYKIVHQEPTPLRSIVPEIPEAVEGVINIALHKKPEDRFASMQAFSRALEHALIGAGLLSMGGFIPMGSVGAAAGLPPTMVSTAGDAQAAVGPTMPSDAAVGQQDRGKATTLSSSAGELQEEAVEIRPPTRRLPLVIGGALAALLVGAISVVLLSSGGDGGKDGTVADRPASKEVAARSPSTPPPTRPPLLMRTVKVAGSNSRISCHLQREGGKTRTATVPCSFEVPDRTPVRLEVRFGRYRPLVEAWTVDSDRQLDVRLSARRRRILLARPKPTPPVPPVVKARPEPTPPTPPVVKAKPRPTPPAPPVVKARPRPTPPAPPKPPAVKAPERLPEKPAPPKPKEDDWNVF